MTFAPVRNGEAFPRADVPIVALEAFRTEIVDRVADAGRIAAMFGTRGDPVEIWVAVADPGEGQFWLGRTRAEEQFPSLTPELPQIHLFEREIAEQFGLVPVGHPWLKPVRFAPPVHGDQATPEIGVMDYYKIEGDEIHEVAVGPVHAGVIEPGHFRFQCHGERVLHLEISLGYQHRGVERALRGGPDKRSLHLAETLSGDTTVAHALAYVQLVEALAGCEVSARAMALRGVALELERLANHTGDLGALAGDVGFLPTASFCGRLRGDWLNLTAQICGNRFGRSLVRPGGVVFDVDAARAQDMLERVDAAMADLRPSVQLLWGTPSVMSRFEETGRVDAATAAMLGLVGPCARAAGLTRDARVDFPSGIYLFEQVPISTWTSGDVFARAFVRAAEIERSADFVRRRLARLPKGSERVDVGPIAPDRVCVSVVEGWRGEVVHVALTDRDGRFDTYKVVDPSFHNWAGVAMAVRGEQISDFPLCNKSFNLSYCGFDL